MWRMHPAAYLALGFLLIAALLWGFAAIAEDIPEQGRLIRLDLAVNGWFHTHASAAGDRIFSMVSWVGGPALLAVGLIAAITLAYWRDWLRLLLWVVALGGGTLLDLLLKSSFRRARPEFAAQFLHTNSWSFPSGHAMSSLIGYGMLAFLLLPYIGSSGRRGATVAFTAALVGAIGFSRLYLGVHYLSDVVAGFLAGGAWLLVCIGAYRVETHRRLPRAGEQPGALFPPATP
ncbi:MAG: hypothetical protein NVS4B3_04800 [Gemmatimonadaceae bacterium]